MLDAGTIAKAELIGGGNLSAGLREAVKRARKPANGNLTGARADVVKSPGRAGVRLKLWLGLVAEGEEL